MEKGQKKAIQTGKAPKEKAQEAQLIIPPKSSNVIGGCFICPLFLFFVEIRSIYD